MSDIEQFLGENDINVPKEMVDILELFDSIDSIDQDSYSNVLELICSFDFNYSKLICEYILFVTSIRPQKIQLIYKLFIESCNKFDFYTDYKFVQKYSYYMMYLLQEHDYFHGKHNSKVLDFIENNRDLFNNKDYEKGTLQYCIMNDDLEGFQKALVMNNVQFVNFSLLDGINPNNTADMSFQITLLSYCAYHGASQCFKALFLNCNKIPKNSDEKALSIELCAIIGGNNEIIELLQQKRVNFLNQKCYEAALQYHRYDIARWISENTDVDEISLGFASEHKIYRYLLKLDKNEEMMNDILYDAANSGFDQLYYYLTQGNDFEYKHDQKILENALQSGNIDFIEYLFKHRYNVCQPFLYPVLLNSPQSVKITQILLEHNLSFSEYTHDFLVKIFKCGNFKIFDEIKEMDQILKEIAKDDEHCYVDDPTLLYYASKFDESEIIQFLLQNVPKPDEYIDICGPFNMTPLINACRYRNRNSIQILLDNGADSSFIDWSGFDAAHYASMNDIYGFFD